MENIFKKISRIIVLLTCVAFIVFVTLAVLYFLNGNVQNQVSSNGKKMFEKLEKKVSDLNKEIKTEKFKGDGIPANFKSPAPRSTVGKVKQKQSTLSESQLISRAKKKLHRQIEKRQKKAMDVFEKLDRALSKIGEQ